MKNYVSISAALLIGVSTASRTTDIRNTGMIGGGTHDYRDRHVAPHRHRGYDIDSPDNYSYGHDVQHKRHRSRSSRNVNQWDVKEDEDEEDE
jgi:hypothetical protein